MKHVLNSVRSLAKRVIPFWMAGLFALFVASASPAGDWPQWLGANREGVWRETGLVERFPPGGPPVPWRAALGGGYSGPAIADGRVYVMDRQRPTDAAGKPRPSSRNGIPGNERIVCFRESDGKLLWTHAYDCPYKISYPGGPRTTPLIHQGHVYTLGAMGDICCLNAENGKPIWSLNLAKTYKATVPPWGYAAHPILEGDRLITLAGGEGSAVVALNKDTGKEVWKALTTEEICYSPPMIFSAGGCRQLIIWHSEPPRARERSTRNTL
jgi:outer membrane protein assembly factor BamB